MVPSRVISVRGVEARPAGDGLVIRGQVRRTPDNCCDRTHGAVAVLLVSPEGEVLDSTQVSWTPRNLPKGQTGGSRFAVTLPYVPTEEFRLRIAYSPE